MRVTMEFIHSSIITVGFFCGIVLTSYLPSTHAADIAVTCQKETNCRCTLTDNSFYYDLAPMLVDTTPPFFNVKDGNLRYFYDPCRNFTMENVLSSCEDVALCKEDDEAEQVYQNLGIHPTSEFRYSADSTVQLRILYHNGMSGAEQVNSTVYLHCDTNGIARFEHKQSTSSYYLFDLYSSFACPKPVPIPPTQLTGGAVLCIIFAVVVILYFGGGFIYLFFYKFERGVKLIPHHEFWTSLPGLIKDGAIFACTCACGESSRMSSLSPNYESI